MAASHQKITTEQATGSFLFRQIQANPEFRAWSQANSIPDYITDNIAADKQLRPYQEDALKAFMWVFDRNKELAKHLLFNMATGTGKTLVMVCCVLFLYQRGYRNFVFTVSRDNIIKQAEKNFTDYNFDKFLFNKRGIRINGRRVNVVKTSTPARGDSNDINFTFLVINTLYNRLREPHENQLSLQDFQDNKIVIIADEAHHLNVDTRSKKKSDAEEAQNWETVINQAVAVNPDNMLLEFTATVDLKDKNVRAKYQNKLVYRYSFLEFNRDGYSKSVRFLYNDETQVEDQKRQLIINAVALSEFRRLFAERTMRADIKPIILVKSTKIAKSEEDREFFDKVIADLNVHDLRNILENAERNKQAGHIHEYEMEYDMIKWITTPSRSGLGNSWNKDDALKAFIGKIKTSFAHGNTLIYNSQKKENPELLTELDNPRNNIRAIFSVNALNEGWDVLSLYDIIHFDISKSKRVSLQDIQLIGRGARYCPYKLPASYRRDGSAMFDEVNRNLATDKYKRKFDNDPHDTARALETMVYHFVKTGTFMNDLQRDLKGEGIIGDEVQERTIHLKPTFMSSKTYTDGFVLINRPTKRTRTTDDEIETTFSKQIVARKYLNRAASLTDREQNIQTAGEQHRIIRIDEPFFSRPIIETALVRAENNFFRFANLRKHIVGIKSVNELIDDYLPQYTIDYWYEAGYEIENLNPANKLTLLINTVLPEVRKSIDLNMPREIGSSTFHPVALSDIFEKKKTVYLTARPNEDPSTGKITYEANDERGRAQTDNANYELRYDVKNARWYAYDENYGTSEEKKLVKWLAEQIPNLQQKFPDAEIYLIRNELDFYLCSLRDGRRFSPDYVLIINDVVNKKMYYQAIIEPKGDMLLQKDAWKEQLLMDINSLHDNLANDINSCELIAEPNMIVKLRQNGYQEIRPIGLPFFTRDNDEQRAKFTDAFNNLLK